MKKIINNSKITTYLFVIYLLFLSWIILFKMQFSLQSWGILRNINLIPYAASGPRFEITYNIIAFIPFGIYINMLKCDWSFIKKITAIAGTSLIYELMQYVLGIGITDITDLINNTLGGLIGLLIYILFLKIFRTKERTNKIINILAGISTVCLAALIAVLLISNI